MASRHSRTTDTPCSRPTCRHGRNGAARASIATWRDWSRRSSGRGTRIARSAPQHGDRWCARHALGTARAWKFAEWGPRRRGVGEHSSPRPPRRSRGLDIQASGPGARSSHAPPVPELPLRRWPRPHQDVRTTECLPRDAGLQRHSPDMDAVRSLDLPTLVVGQARPETTMKGASHCEDIKGQRSTLEAGHSKERGSTRGVAAMKAFLA